MAQVTSPNCNNYASLVIQRGFFYLWRETCKILPDLTGFAPTAQTHLLATAVANCSSQRKPQLNAGAFLIPTFIKDKHLYPNKLQAEKEGILAWLARGSKRWYSSIESNNGNPALGSCHAVDEATQNYINDNDTFGAFLVACTDKDTEAMVNASDLYASYQDWSRLNGEQYQMGTAIFSSRLQERGYTKKRTNKGNVYLGLSLKPDAEGDF